MKKTISILLYTLVWLWLYCITFLQLFFPFTLQVIILAFVLYVLLYLGIHQRLIKGKIRAFLSLGAFTITFSVFWTSIIYLIFFFADLLPNKTPSIMLLNALIYAPLYVLFYRSIRTKPQSPAVQSRSTLHFILEITFPILVSTGMFTGALFLYSQLQQAGIAFSAEGLTMLLTLITTTAVGTVLAVHLFEAWLQIAEKREMEKVLLMLMAAGILFTILLVRNNLT
jgi:hypothetical protein